jgi:hypothetical protein
LLRSNSLKIRPLDDKKREITFLQEVETKAKGTFQKETQGKIFVSSLYLTDVAQCLIGNDSPFAVPR